MKLTNIFMVIGVSSILIITALTILDIGQLKICNCTSVYTWEDTGRVFIVLTLPFIVGYLARDPNVKTIFDD